MPDHPRGHQRAGDGVITAAQYFGAKAHSQDEAARAADLLQRVNALLDDAAADGAHVGEVDPDTGSEISGSKGGAGDGGFRLPTSTTGSARSSHKEARAVDVYDPAGRLDDWLDTFEHGVGDNTKLAEHGLYREAPSHTPGWCHLTTRAPGSGRRTFNP